MSSTLDATLDILAYMMCLEITKMELIFYVFGQKNSRNGEKTLQCFES